MHFNISIISCTWSNYLVYYSLYHYSIKYLT